MPSGLRVFLEIILSIPIGIFLVAVLYNGGLALVYIIVPRLLPPSDHPGLDILHKRLRKTKTANRIVGALGGMVIIVNWPVTGRHFLMPNGMRANISRAAATLRLRSVDQVVAVFGLCVAVFITVVDVTRLAWPPLVTITAWLMLGGLVCRHLTYLIPGGGLPQRLRTAAKQPYLTAGVVGIADALTLILYVKVLFVVGALNAGTLRACVLDLYAFRRLATLVHDTPAQVLVALIGGLFYFVVAKTILSPKQYKRTNEDLQNIGASYLILGDLRKAREWLDKEDAKTLGSFTVLVALEVAAGNFDQALTYANTCQRLEGREPTEDSSLHRIHGLTLWQPDLSTQLRADLITWAIARSASDATVYLMVLNTSIVSADDFDELADLVLDHLPAERYPLARALTVMFGGAPHEAGRILRIATPTSGIEQMIRLVMFLELEIVEAAAEPEEDVVDTWRAESLPEIIALAKDLPYDWKKAAATMLAHLATEVRVVGYGDLADELVTLASATGIGVITSDELSRFSSVNRDFMTA